MKILVFSWRDPSHPMAGGAEQVMHEHMKYWVRNGHSVTLFSSKFKDTKGNEVSGESTLDGIHVIRKGRQILEVQLMAFLWYFQGRKTDYDLVVDQFHGIPFFAPLYIRKPILAVIQEIAGNVWFKNHLSFPLNYLIGFLGFVAEPLMFIFYRNCMFMTGSESTKNELEKIGKIKSKNITIIPHGILQSGNVKQIKKNRKKTIIFLGALAKDKGIEDALKVFQILNTKGSFNFWVVGKCGEDYQKYLFALSDEYGIMKTVKFFGFVSNEKKYELLSRSHILLNPSMKEGWGLVNIEANSVGTPVCAYVSPGLVDSIKEGVSGYFSRKNTPESLADCVISALSPESKYKSISIASKKWASKFNWSNSLLRGLELVNKMV